ncbi:MAG: hypothetical protein KIT62_06685 [Cyclobacteriaceae bacterium]|nr:hypothetical protein [Cyclobacteriaceae bacterium]
MSRLLILLFSFAFVKVINAQSTSTQMGARGLGMGNASTGIAYEWGLFNNPGSIGLLTETTAAAAYHAQTRLTNANRAAFVLNSPFRFGVASVGTFRFGDDLYNEHLVSAGMANKFGITSLGLKVNYIQYQAQGFDSHRAMTLDFGGITQLTEAIFISASINNLTQSKIKSEHIQESLPTRLTAGLTCKVNSKVLVATEIEKDLLYAATWRTGLEYEFRNKFFARTGFNLQPSSGFFGLGTKQKSIRADYAIQLNALTGASHQASVTYQFNRKKS